LQNIEIAAVKKNPVYNLKFNAVLVVAEQRRVTAIELGNGGSGNALIACWIDTVKEVAEETYRGGRGGEGNSPLVASILLAKVRRARRAVKEGMPDSGPFRWRHTVRVTRAFFIFANLQYDPLSLRKPCV
jgi:hypothetical protein